MCRRQNANVVADPRVATNADAIAVVQKAVVVEKHAVPQQHIGEVGLLEEAARLDPGSAQTNRRQAKPFVERSPLLWREEIRGGDRVEEEGFERHGTPVDNGASVPKASPFNPLPTLAKG